MFGVVEVLASTGSLAGVDVGILLVGDEPVVVLVGGRRKAVLSLEALKSSA